MKTVTLLKRSEFEVLFSERLFNPPAEDDSFGEEFEDALDRLQVFLEERLSPDEFSLHPYHNQSRFLDVVFESVSYLDTGLVKGLQEELSAWPKAWMVSLFEACYLFVTPDAVLAFDPVGGTPAFRQLCDDLNN